MGDKIRVLQVKPGKGIIGGTSAVLLMLDERMDRSRFQITVLSTGNHMTEEYCRRLSACGTAEKALMVKDGNKLKYALGVKKRLGRYLDTHDFDVIHINSGSVWKNALLLSLVKKKTDAPVIVHSHNAKTVKHRNKLVNRMMKRYLGRKADYRLACSGEAGRCMFPKKKSFEVLTNGIDFSIYRKSEAEREKARERVLRETGLDGRENLTVIGHVGRFVPQKNHPFLIDWFHAYHANREQTVLLLVGAGEDEEKIRALVDEKGLTDSVIFLGERYDMPDVYAAMDLFVLPSRYEGFGLVAVEAQAAGVPALLSDAVPREVLIEGAAAERLPLEESVQVWCEAADSLTGSAGKPEGAGPDHPHKQIYDPRLDIEEMTRRLEKIYTEAALCTPKDEK